MINRIKTYFTIKKLKKQLKYKLITHIGLFVSDKEKYLNLLHELIEMPVEDAKEKFVTSLSGFKDAQNEPENDIPEE